jgi:hypothetical protein
MSTRRGPSAAGSPRRRAQPAVGLSTSPSPFPALTGFFGAAGLVALVVLAGYLHTLSYPFQFDDLLNIQANAALARPFDVAANWRFRPSRVVVYLSLAWNGALTGLTPRGLRIGNLLIHVLAALLVGWLAKELTRRLAPRAPPEAARSGRPSPEMVGLLSALLFAAHPLATQAVTYLIQRTTSLAALLELAAVAAYLRARRDGATRFWLASWACAILAALTKEMAIALPFLIGLTEIALRRVGAPGRPRLRMFLPFLAVEPLVAWAVQLPWGLAGELIPAVRQSEHFSRVAYLTTQILVIPRYLALVLWPHGQSLVHDVALHPRVDLPVLGGLAVLGALSLGAWWLRARAPVAAYGWAWFMIAILPESSIFPIADIMSEHRTYLPLAGLALGGATGLAGWSGERGARWMVPAVLIVGLTTATHVRNRVWLNETTLWSDVLRRSPGNALALNNLGLEFRRAGRFAESESAFRRAIVAEPRRSNAYLNLGSLLGARGRAADAVAALDSGVAAAPREWRVFYSLGSANWLAGDTAAAARAYLQAIALAPGEPTPRAALELLRSSAPPAR